MFFRISKHMNSTYSTIPLYKQGIYFLNSLILTAWFSIFAPFIKRTKYFNKKHDHWTRCVSSWSSMIADDCWQTSPSPWWRTARRTCWRRTACRTCSRGSRGRSPCQRPCPVWRMCLRSFSAGQVILLGGWTRASLLHFE